MESQVGLDVVVDGADEGLEIGKKVNVELE